MKESLRKLKLKDIDDFHNKWYRKYNDTLYYSTRITRGMDKALLHIPMALLIKA
jgi:hypothetical protein